MGSHGPSFTSPRSNFIASWYVEGFFSPCNVEFRMSYNASLHTEASVHKVMTGNKLQVKERAKSVSE
jgi:hypothetical protein